MYVDTASCSNGRHEAVGIGSANMDEFITAILDQRDQLGSNSGTTQAQPPAATNLSLEEHSLNKIQEIRDTGVRYGNGIRSKEKRHYCDLLGGAKDGLTKRRVSRHV